MHQLTKIELDLYEAHLLRLDSAARHLRFKGHVHDAVIHQYVENIRESEVDEAIFAEMSSTDVIGAVHISIYPNTDMAELSVSVESEHRGNGLGEKLFERAILWAKNRGATKITAECFTHNRAMMCLARKHEMKLEMEGSDTTGILNIDSPDLMDHWIEYQKLPWEKYEELKTAQAMAFEKILDLPWKILKSIAE
jgi:GNAT superfamily N-acetyltransferase